MGRETEDLEGKGLVGVGSPGAEQKRVSRPERGSPKTRVAGGAAKASPGEVSLPSMSTSRAPIKASISKDLFDRIDIRAGTIRRVEEVAGSRKLVKLVVDFGDHTRSILAGIKGERANPQGLAGIQSLFVVNLEPRTMAGERSEGMLLDIGYADGITPVLALLENPVPDGARAG
jgi:methionine--tRNA ligase beta chain